MTLDNNDADFDKAVGQLRFALTAVMKPLRLYGQGDYVDSAIDEIISLAIQLYQRLEGIDEPYHINNDRLRHWKDPLASTILQK